MSLLPSLVKITLKQIYCLIVLFQFEIKRQKQYWGLLAGFFFCLSIGKKIYSFKYVSQFTIHCIISYFYE